MRNNKGQFVKGHSMLPGGEKGWFKLGVKKGPLSEEHKKHIKEGRIGMKLSDEHKANLKKNHRGFIGKKHTIKTIEGMRGENNSRWIEDRSKLKKSENKMSDTQYRYWMLGVKKRDCWKCKMNNKDCIGRLEAHHILNWIDYPELRYEINNGITLCVAHHPRKRKEEKRLSPYFQKLILNEKGWSEVEKDRELLKIKLAQL